MKTFLVLLTTLCAFNASAISFYTEEDVQKAYGADKVIEVSSRGTIQKLLEPDSECQKATYSKSSRAYIVKKGYDTYLVVTPNQIADMLVCVKI